ncbi:hypothetical protein AADZ90_021240 [Aestuariibius sp. 2305UL40-4]|uniref:hypothetical protein n=1 Tax=Aestuariibius violaceus TaxID=3234132 RepID=UPI00345E9ABA
MSRVKVDPYRSEPEMAPPLSERFCNWCDGPLPRGKARYCSEQCKKDWQSFITAFGKRIAPWLLITRAQRPRTGKEAGPAYSKAQNRVRDMTDETLSRLRTAQRRATGGR